MERYCTLESRDQETISSICLFIYFQYSRDFTYPLPNLSTKKRKKIRKQKDDKENLLNK